MDEHPRPTIIVANLTGGVGKTTMTRLIQYVWAKAGSPFDLVSIDSVDETSTSKLASLGDDVEQLTVGVDPGAVDQSKIAVAMVEHWDRLGEMLGEGGHLIDFGANAIQNALAWAEKAKPRDLLVEAPPLIVVIPVTRNSQAAANAVWVLNRLDQVRADFMDFRAIVAFNDAHGVVADFQSAEFKVLRKLVTDRRIETLTVPHGVLDLAESHSFMELATVDVRAFAREMELTPFRANTRLRFFLNWLEPAAQSVDRAGLGPVEPVGSARSGDPDRGVPERAA